MTKDQALVRARGLYGKGAFVGCNRVDGTKRPFFVGERENGFRVLRGFGANWEEALAEAERDAIGVPLRLLPEELDMILTTVAYSTTRCCSTDLIARLESAREYAMQRVAVSDRKRRASG